MLAVLCGDINLDQRTFDIINRISVEHSHKTFGYLDEQDLKNEIWQICLEKLKDYDHTRGELEHFLRVSVKNRLVNRFKDVTKSVRSPCPRCQYYDPSGDGPACTKYGENKNDCSKWRNYQLSIESRNSLLNATEPQNERVISDNMLNKIASDELKLIIDKEIGVSFRHDFQQLISGGKLSKQRLKRLRKEILNILNKYETNSKELVSLKVRGKNANAKTKREET